MHSKFHHNTTENMLLLWSQKYTLRVHSWRFSRLYWLVGMQFSCKYWMLSPSSFIKATGMLSDQIYSIFNNKTFNLAASYGMEVSAEHETCIKLTKSYQSFDIAWKLAHPNVKLTQIGISPKHQKVRFFQLSRKSSQK